jgi:hypothetical protein
LERGRAVLIGGNSSEHQKISKVPGSTAATPAAVYPMRRKEEGKEE